MSNFPFAWWNKTITVYNRIIDTSTNRISWQKTTVTNCFWKCANNIYNMGRYGMSSLGIRVETKEVICRIPKDDRFVDKKTWRSLTDKSGHFTLANGDIVILGDVEDTIDEYATGKRSTDLIAKYKEEDACLEVDTYVDNVQTGVGLEHYRVVGK